MAAAGATTVMSLLNSPAGRFTFEAPGSSGSIPAAAPKAADQGDVGEANLPAGKGGSSNAPGGAVPAGEGGSGAGAAPAGADPDGSPAAFEAFLAEVAQTGVVPLQMPLFSAHQMGTCRLGEQGLCVQAGLDLQAHAGLCQPRPGACRSAAL